MSQSRASGLSAALGHEPLGHELEAEWLGPNGVSNGVYHTCKNTSQYLRIEALSIPQKALSGMPKERDQSKPGGVPYGTILGL